MALGDDEAEILVVLHLVGAEEHRRLVADGARRLGGGAQSRRAQAAARARRAAEMSRGAPHRVSAVLEMEQQAHAEQAADARRRPGGERRAGWSRTGPARTPRRRGNRARSRWRRRRRSSTSAPPRRCMRRLKLAAISTIAANRKRPRQKRVEIEPVALRREARVLEQPDEARQLPERHRLGRGEAVLDLARREIGRRPSRALERLQRLRAGLPHRCRRVTSHLPAPSRASLRIDALGELAVVGEEQEQSPRAASCASAR